MPAAIRDILIISTPDDFPSFKTLLGTGQQWGGSFTFAEQPHPDGLAQAFIIGEEFIGNDNVCLVLGDNIFYGQSFTQMLTQAVERAELQNQATIFDYAVKDANRYGVVSFDAQGNATKIVEKPQNPETNFAVTGLYFYPNSVIEISKAVKPSARGELEISSVNQVYVNHKQVHVQTLGRGFAWLDTGTADSMLEAANFIKAIETRQGVQVASLEEIAFRKGYITAQQLLALAAPMQKNDYGKYLTPLAQNEV